MAGFVAFPLIAFHLRAASVVSDAVIPLLYALAMGMDAVAALLTGWAYDRAGLAVLVVIPALNLPVAFLAFWATGSPTAALPAAALAAVIWGASLGAQETVMRAAVADLVPIRRRGSAYGIFNTVYGGAWFLGSVTFGLLYDQGLLLPLVLLSAVLQVLSVPAVLRLRVMAAAGPPR
jgi:MFS family permease